MEREEGLNLRFCGVSREVCVSISTWVRAGFGICPLTNELSIVLSSPAFGFGTFSITLSSCFRSEIVDVYEDFVAFVWALWFQTLNGSTLENISPCQEFLSDPQLPEDQNISTVKLVKSGWSMLMSSPN